MSSDKKSKKKEVNIDRLEQLMNKYQKKKTLSKPSNDLMSQINNRISNIRSKSKQVANVKNQKPEPKNIPNKSSGKSSNKSPGKSSNKSPGKSSNKSPGKSSGKSPKKSSNKSSGKSKIKKEVSLDNINENIVAHEIDEMLRLEDDKKKAQIEQMTTAAKLKAEFLDLFNRDKNKPLINNSPPVKIPKKSKKKILEEVSRSRVSFNPNINVVPYNIPSTKQVKTRGKTQRNNKNQILESIFDHMKRKGQNLPAMAYKTNIETTQAKQKRKTPRSKTPKYNPSHSKSRGRSYSQQLKSMNQQFNQYQPMRQSNINAIIPKELQGQITPEMVQSNPYIRRDLEQKYEFERKQRLKELEAQRQHEKYLMKKQLYEEKQRRKELERQQYLMYQKMKKQRRPKYTFREPTNTMDIIFQPRYPKHLNRKIIKSSGSRSGSNYNNRYTSQTSFSEPRTSDMIKEVTLSGANSSFVNTNSNGNMKFVRGQKAKQNERTRNRDMKSNLQQNLDLMIKLKREKQNKQSKLIEIQSPEIVNNLNTKINNSDPSNVDIRSLLASLASKNTIDEIRDEIAKLGNFENELVQDIQTKLKNSKKETNSQNNFISDGTYIITKEGTESKKSVIDMDRKIAKQVSESLKGGKKSKPKRKRERKRKSPSKSDIQKQSELEKYRNFQIWQKRKSQKQKLFKDFRWEAKLCSEINNMKRKHSFKHYKLRQKRRPYYRFRLNDSIIYKETIIPKELERHKLLDHLVRSKIIKLKDRFRPIPDEIFQLLYKLLYQQHLKIIYQ